MAVHPNSAMNCYTLSRYTVVSSSNMKLQYLGKRKNIDHYYKLHYTNMIFFKTIYCPHMYATMAPKPVCWQKFGSVIGIASRDNNTS
jgi:hypothetical protein